MVKDGIIWGFNKIAQLNRVELLGAILPDSLFRELNAASHLLRV